MSDDDDDEMTMTMYDYLWMIFRVTTLCMVGLILFHEDHVPTLLAYGLVVFLDHFSVEIS